ncbi:Tetratricopeptide repeat (TPR)-like superfamily protein, partial [Zostera marina]
LAEFQVGLGVIASLSGHLLCSHVFGSVTQAVQRVPFCPVSHNLNGLICEARGDFQSAIVSYKQARYTLDIFPTSGHKYKAAEVSFNLSRSLFKSGYIYETARECEHLKNE